MEKLVIDRGQWLTGTAGKLLGAGTLRDRKTGLMCCLGIYAKKLGATDAELNGKGLLVANRSELSCEVPNWLAQDCDRVDTRGKQPYDVEDALAATNDSDSLHQIRREARIAKFFKKYGDVEVTFTGRYADATRKARKVYGTGANL